MIALKSFFVEGNQLTGINNLNLNNLASKFKFILILNLILFFFIILLGNIPQSLSQLENLLEIRLYNNKLTRNFHFFQIYYHFII